MDIVSFEPFSTLLHPTFWHKLTQLKLNVLQLDESAIPVFASYGLEGSRNIPPQFSIDYTAFEAKSGSGRFVYHCQGKLINTNTIEGFQALCTRNSLAGSCKEVFNEIASGEALEHPDLLNKFLFLCHGDLKRYRFHFWLAFPAVSPSEPFSFSSKPQAISNSWSIQQFEKFEKVVTAENFEFSTIPFFAYDEKNNAFLSLSKAKSLGCSGDSLIFCFSDPSMSENFGWPLRNYLMLVQQHFCGNGCIIKFLSLRRSKSADHQLSFKESLLFDVKMTKVQSLSFEQCSISGWERDRRSGKLQPGFVDMSGSMDPVKLAAEAVTLNLRLMKWRVAPELNLDRIANTSCLLLGCGTLGCNVARCLMSWGVHKMALVDNGKISFSNPVRQSLFTFQHCTDSKLMKADAAAESLRLINPGVTVSSHPELTIPMPGHPFSPATLADGRKNWEQLDKLFRECDVVFLLTDSRESRWLPTVMAAAYGKLAITSALGFDSFLVMRHGCSEDKAGKLGCYFCTDVVGPTNSLRERTLDQQCTVSRGGVSMLASGLAVELMISVLDHPAGASAPANSSDNCLGIVPHQIRGFLSKYEQLVVNSSAFENCSACSPAIVDAYKKGGFDFVAQVCSNPGYLEELSGLADLQRESAKLSLEDFCPSSDDDE